MFELLRRRLLEVNRKYKSSLIWRAQVYSRSKITLSSFKAFFNRETFSFPTIRAETFVLSKIMSYLFLCSTLGDMSLQNFPARPFSNQNSDRFEAYQSSKGRSAYVL